MPFWHRHHHDDTKNKQLGTHITEQILQEAKKLGDLAESGQHEALVTFARNLPVENLRHCVNASTGDEYEETALHRACYAGNLEAVFFLLELSADPLSTQSIVRSTPLHSACAGGHEEIVKLLIQCSSSSATYDPSRLVVNYQTTTGWTPLHSAVQRKFVNIAKTLVFHGADLYLKNNDGLACASFYQELLQEELLSPQPAVKSASNVIELPGISMQIASDLHLEFYTGPADFSSFIVPSAPILALLGDIGIPLENNIYARFLLSMADKFQLVLVLAGNHEYYNSRGTHTVSEVKKAIQEICDSHPRLVFMDKTSLLVNGVRILGCSLWSFIPEFAYAQSENYLNDYRMIYYNNPDGSKAKLSAKISTSWFHDESTWLQTEVSQSMQRGEHSTVILTHHTPSFYYTAEPEWNTHPWKSFPASDTVHGERWVNCCFSSSMESIFANHKNVGNSNVKLWAYGHSHFNNDQQLWGTRLVSNQRGYKQDPVSTYSPRFVVHVA